MAFTDKLTAIANAIRGQSNKTAKLSLDQMPVEITNLPTIGFEIIGGTSAPGNPKTNDIWVNTPHAITGWGFIDRNPGWSHNDGWVYVVAAVSCTTTVGFMLLRQYPYPQFPLISMP